MSVIAESLAEVFSPREIGAEQAEIEAYIESAQSGGRAVVWYRQQSGTNRLQVNFARAGRYSDLQLARLATRAAYMAIGQYCRGGLKGRRGPQKISSGERDEIFAAGCALAIEQARNLAEPDQLKVGDLAETLRPGRWADETAEKRDLQALAAVISAEIIGDPRRPETQPWRDKVGDDLPDGSILESSGRETSAGSALAETLPPLGDLEPLTNETSAALESALDAGTLSRAEGRAILWAIAQDRVCARDLVGSRYAKWYRCKTENAVYTNISAGTTALTSRPYEGALRSAVCEIATAEYGGHDLGDADLLALMSEPA